MKQYVSLLLALAMVLTMTVVAAAQTHLSGTGEETHAVVGAFVPLEDAEIIFCVDVTWGSMEFTYSAGSFEYVWDPETHEYVLTLIEDENNPIGWRHNDGANLITVTNRSNQAITASVTVSMSENYSAITATVTGGEMLLDSASEGATLEVYGQATSSTASIALNGALTDTQAKSTAIGTITILLNDLIADEPEETTTETTGDPEPDPEETMAETTADPEPDPEETTAETTTEPQPDPEA